MGWTWLYRASWGVPNDSAHLRSGFIPYLLYFRSQSNYRRFRPSLSQHRRRFGKNSLRRQLSRFDRNWRGSCRATSSSDWSSPTWRFQHGTEALVIPLCFNNPRRIISLTLSWHKLCQLTDWADARSSLELRIRHIHLSIRSHDRCHNRASNLAGIRIYLRSIRILVTGCHGRQSVDARYLSIQLRLGWSSAKYVDLQKSGAH